MPAAPGGSAAVVIEALELFKVDYCFVGATSAYNSGKSEQIPISLCHYNWTLKCRRASREVCR
jgi:hypothetical protein